jgi:polar amino acid transport system substrate-binding protein
MYGKLCFARLRAITKSALAGVFVGALALTTLRAYADTISIRADEWAPINTDTRNPNHGVMIELAERIWGQAGHKVDYRILDWDDALASAKSGLTDCVVGANADEAKSNSLRTPKAPWVVSQITAYARSDRNISITSVSDLLQYRVGLIGVNGYGPEVDSFRDQNVENPARTYVASGSRALRDLMLRLNVGQVDLVLETNVVMDYNLALSRLDGRIKAVGSPVKNRDELYIACSAKKSSTENYIKLLDEGMLKMRANGEFKALLAKYRVRDWE